MSQHEREHAHPACNAGFGAAVFVAVVTTIVAFASLTGVQAVPGATVNLLALIDAAVFAAVAWGIRRHSRLAAVAGLALFVLEKVGTPPPNPGGWLVAAVLLGCFVAGVVGVFSHHRAQERVPEVAPA